MSLQTWSIWLLPFFASSVLNRIPGRTAELQGPAGVGGGLFGGAGFSGDDMAIEVGHRKMDIMLCPVVDIETQ
jgi:hypothetical protein